VAAFRGLEVRGKAVLVHTGWDRHWRTDAYFEGHPHLTGEAARWLAEAGAALVGIDSYNIDDTAGGERPVHSTLLGAEIPICEHLRGLESLSGGFRFTAAPVKVARFGTFPVRAFAVGDARGGVAGTACPDEWGAPSGPGRLRVRATSMAGGSTHHGAAASKTRRAPGCAIFNSNPF
jgi:hypothetical protein